MAEKKGCKLCVNHDTKALEQIGPTEHNEYLGGKATESIDVFRCKACGTKWRRIVERGAGGPGRHWTVVE